MAKPQWGAKRQCPKCGTRFYDLGKDDPITCISCGHAFHYEPLLKSRRPREEAEEAPASKKKEAAASNDKAESLEDSEENLDIEEVSIESGAESDVISLDEGEDEDVSGVIQSPVDENDD